MTTSTSGPFLIPSQNQTVYTESEAVDENHESKTNSTLADTSSKLSSRKTTQASHLGAKTTEDLKTVKSSAKSENFSVVSLSIFILSNFFFRL